MLFLLWVAKSMGNNCLLVFTEKSDHFRVAAFRPQQPEFVDPSNAFFFLPPVGRKRGPQIGGGGYFAEFRGIVLFGKTVSRFPSSAFYPFLGEGSPIKINYRRKSGTLILISLLEDLDVQWQINYFLGGIQSGTWSVRLAVSLAARRVGLPLSAQVQEPRATCSHLCCTSLRYPLLLFWLGTWMFDSPS